MTIHRIVFLLLLLQSLIVTAQTGQPKYSKEIEEKIARVEKGLVGWAQIVPDSAGGWNIKDRMAFHNIHGVSIAVIKDYKLEWARGYGWADTTDKRPATVNTLFQAASISKSLNAMGVLKLVADKKIEFDKDINTYLRSWKFPYDSLSKGKPITIAHLLSHSAGLSVHGFPGYKWTDSLPTDNDILDGKRPANTKAVRSEFEPGLRVKYSGGGTTISKKIIIDVTGQPYDVYMRQAVLQPIGMKNSFYTQPPPPRSFPNLATAYSRNGKPVKGNFHIYPEQAADGLWTNPTDLAQYIIEMQLSAEGKSNKVLPKEIIEKMLTPYIDKSSALGVMVDQRGMKKYFGHGGANEGFRCQYFGSIYGGDGVVVMVNSDNGAIMPEIINAVANVYNWVGFYNPAKKITVKVSADTLKTYTGTYTIGNSLLNVIEKGSDLYVIQDQSPPAKMYFTSNNTFFIMEVNAEMQFQKNAAGIVDTIAIKQGGGEFKAKRK